MELERFQSISVIHWTSKAEGTILKVIFLRGENTEKNLHTLCQEIKELSWSVWQAWCVGQNSLVCLKIIGMERKVGG